MEWSDAGSIDAFKEGPNGVRIGTQQVVIVRRGERFDAVQALCPHKFAPLAEGHLENGCLACPVHDAHFDPATGDPREGDGWAGRLQTYPCRASEGRVQVGL